MFFFLKFKRIISSLDGILKHHHAYSDRSMFAVLFKK
jgi:hypothetical protein